MIIFNDSVSKFYQCSIWRFYHSISLLFSIYLRKWNVEVIKFLGILKKCVSENQINFCSKNKSNISLNKKIIFVFHTIFRLDFITQIIYCIINRCLCSHFILLLFFYSSLYEMEHTNNANLILFVQFAKVNNNHKMNEKRSQEYQSMNPEYVTGQINSRILELFWGRFCCLTFAPSQISSYVLF